jgi:hypothetical protein
MTRAKNHSTPTARIADEPDDAPFHFHITDWTPWREEALGRVAQAVGHLDRAAEALRHGVLAGEIEAIDLRVFCWGDREEYNLPGAEQRGVEIGPLPLSPAHKAKWGRIIRAARANNGRLITAGEEDLEGLADEFVRLETFFHDPDRETVDDDTFQARADFWRRLLSTARGNERGDLLTPGGQDIFMIRPRPHLRRADVERLLPLTDWPAANATPSNPVSAPSKDAMLLDVMRAVLDLCGKGFRGAEPAMLKAIAKSPYNINTSHSTLKRAKAALRAERKLT